MSATATGIRGISLVIVPTIDQDRAVEFYESIGFEKRTDVPMGDKYRWVEVYPPEGPTGIALAPPPPDQGEIQPGHTGITLTTDDIDASHAELKARGVEFLGEPQKQPWGTFVLFKDPDGTTFCLSSS